MHFPRIFSPIVLLLAFVAIPAVAHASGLDPISTACLACHDGSEAPHVRFCLLEQMGKGCGGHIVSVLYADIAARDKKLRPPSSLPPELTFYEGKITCCTCHGTEPHLGEPLVMDNHYSALCRTCHRK